MKTTTNVKAGSKLGPTQVPYPEPWMDKTNHNESMKVRSSVKAGNLPVTMDPLPWMSKR